MQNYFKEIHGQHKVKESLSQIYKSGIIPQAMLFVGDEGVGKFHTAIQFLKLINSNISEELSEINQKRIDSFSEPYMKLIFPIPRGKTEVDNNAYQGLSEQQLNEIKEQIKLKKQNPFHKIKVTGGESIKISSIREINQFTSLKFDDLNYRLIAILDAHLMGEEAQNALLKTLEEPPDGIIFILFTDDENFLLPTIRSRCWKISFDTLNEQDLTLILKNNFNYTINDIEKVKYFSEGSVQKAIYLINNNLADLINSTLNILRYSFAGWYSTAIYEFKDIIKNSDYEMMKLIIRLVYTWINNFIKFRSNGESGCYSLFLESISKFNSKYKTVELSELVNQLDLLTQYIDRNINLSIIAVNIVLELSSITTNQKE